MDDEYREIVRKFYELYRPLQKRYNLQSHMHFRLSEDGLIEIWEYKGETKRECILRIREMEDIDCYKRAIEELLNYKREREGKEGEKKSNMANARLAC